jgi:uncharacterized protein (TIGR03437 family)
MLTMYRLPPVRFTSFATMMCFIALGSFDTAEAQSLTLSSTSLVFTTAQGGNPGSTQMVSVGSTGGNLSYSLKFQPNASWLSAAPSGFGGGNSGTAPDTLTVQVNSTSLANGSYSGTITLTPTNGSANAIIAVSLTVTGSGTTTSFISASPQQLSFGYELKQATPPSQTSLITSSGISLPLSFGTNYGNCSSNWFQATLSTNSTPATLTLGISTSGLTAGTCTGNVTLTSTTPTNGTTTTLVGVTLFISTGALLNVSIPAGLQSVTLQSGGAPLGFGLSNHPPNPLVLTSSDPNAQLPFTLATSSINGWLSVTPTSGTTPANITVEIIPGTQATLAVGTYNGSITVTSSGLFNNAITIPISLTITSSSSITVSPSGTQNFTELQGGALPGPLTLTLTGAANQSVQFTTSVIEGSGGAWLQISPSGSLTGTPTSSSGTVTLSVAANTLTQGTYSSQAVITFQSSSIPQILIAVSLTVQQPASAIMATPAAISFSYQAAGGTTPAAQPVTITNPASAPIQFTIAVSDSWLSVTPTTGTTGTTSGTVSVAVSPQGLLSGSYNGSLTLSSPGVATLTVPVALFISASTTPQPFIISNAASGIGSQLSPGEIITIKGSGLGPGNPVSFTVTPVNTLPNPILAGVQVTFSGYSGTLLYVSSTQINVIVPYEIAGAVSTGIIVTYQSAPSAPIIQPVGAASLGLFTNNQAGSGQVAALNPGSSCPAAPCYNTAATPALQGSYVSVYGTGGGQTNPPSSDGEVSPLASLLPLALQSNITATIGGKPAAVLFAGAAPGDVTGVVQLNIQVPTGVSGSALPIVVTINGPISTQSQATATVAVQ